MNHQKADQYKFPFGNSEIVLEYMDDDFSHGRVLGGSSISSESSFEKELETAIEAAIKKIAFLQEVRTRSKKIFAEHLQNRADTERQMVG